MYAHHVQISHVCRLFFSIMPGKFHSAFFFKVFPDLIYALAQLRKLKQLCLHAAWGQTGIYMRRTWRILDMPHGKYVTYLQIALLGFVDPHRQ